MARVGGKIRQLGALERHADRRMQQTFLFSVHVELGHRKVLAASGIPSMICDDETIYSVQKCSVIHPILLISQDYLLLE